MNSHKFKIFQVKKIFSRYHGFLSLESYKKIQKQEINIGRYNLVWEDTINTYRDDEIDILEDLFRLFNIDRPKNFKGHSMSVGDIVEIFGKFYYCDSEGWEAIQVDTKKPKVALEEYLLFEHGWTLNELILKKRLETKDENAIMKYVSDLSKDFAQFCWEEGYEPQKVYFMKDKTNN